VLGSKADGIASTQGLKEISILSGGCEQEVAQPSRRLPQTRDTLFHNWEQVRPTVIETCLKGEFDMVRYYHRHAACEDGVKHATSPGCAAARTEAEGAVPNLRE
jgi:hypothetical protein